MSDLLDRVTVKISQQKLSLHVSLAVVIIALLLGIADAITQSWTCDDAFISFRYAKNLAEGRGLVYNVGEKVEGYTNFLWTILIALAMKCNADPLRFTNTLGITSFILIILTFIYLSWHLFKTQHTLKIFIPLTALCLLAHHDFKVFATGGLETSFFTLLITLGFGGLVVSKNKYSFLVTGFILVLAAMTRPDGIIMYLLSLIFLMATASSTPMRITYFLLPLLILYIPYHTLRFLYYHYPFPNTYYAKSAYLPWWNQGLHYAVLYFKAYYLLLLLPAIGAIALVRTKGGFKKFMNLPFRFNPIHHAVCLSVLFSLVYSLYVMRVGGDFMFARFFIPITPLLYFLFEAFAVRIIDKKYLIPFSVIVCLATYFYWYPHEIRSLSNNIVDEKYFYPKWKIEEAQRKGEILKQYLKDTEALVVIYGSQAMLAYYAEFPAVIEGHNGLTDEYIAHLPAKKRTRPGHEKRAPLEYLVRRGTNFSFSFGLWNPSSDTLRQINFGEVKGTIIVYNRTLMRKLKAYHEVSFTDMEGYLDQYIHKMSSFPRSRILKDYEFFKQYYFNHNPDPLRLNAFINLLGNT